MIASVRYRRLLSRMRWGGALVAGVATVALVSLPGVARAEGPGSDPVSPGGATDSAIIVKWTDGIRDNTNAPIASANADRSSANPQSPLSFMYKDFQTLQVSVNQTKGIGRQGITVTWTGGVPTLGFGVAQANYLQMMECYGDASTGPTPDQCEYGTQLPSSPVPQGVNDRSGFLCPPNAVPSTSKPPPGLDGGNSEGCDTQEPGTSVPSHIDPCACHFGQFYVPFTPVTDPTHPDYKQGSQQYFSPANTNEVQAAFTHGDGTGLQVFQTLTGAQAPGLGCGLQDNNQPRGCWLIIVPRGQYEPNGALYNRFGNPGALATSPLSASNWAQRIQIHLDYAPPPQFCSIGTPIRSTVGTQLITRAMQSWQLALNQAANCAKVYSFSATIESTSTSSLNDPTGAGLAFTTIPIGSEATRTGGSPPPNLPKILYAPVAVTALGFGFNIAVDGGFVSTPMKLTPRLVAKALTQAYLSEIPDYLPSDTTDWPGPAWVRGNPDTIVADPKFQALNPSVTDHAIGGPLPPLIVGDHSALNQQLWHWIQASPAAKSWLGGAADATDNVGADPDYQAYSLGTDPTIDWFPRAYKKCYDGGPVPNANPPREKTLCSLDKLPYSTNFDFSMTNVVARTNLGYTSQWDDNIQSPDNQPGYWDKQAQQAPLATFTWAFADTSNIDYYGVIPAQLCDDLGGNCVGPTGDSLTAALNSAKPDSGGLLQVDPANPGTGAYPLTQVVYAAVRTNQSGAALTDYATLIADAAGSGQITGSSPGDLPPGYLPLTDSLKAQAQSVVTQLQALASGSQSPSASPTASPSPSASTSTTTSGDLGGNGSTTPAVGTTSAPGQGATAGTGGGATTAAGGSGGGTGAGGGGATTATSPAAVPRPSPGAGSLPASGPHPTPTVGAAAGGPVILPAASKAAEGITGATAVGIVHWVLLALIIAGCASAVVGTALWSRLSLAWPRRGRPL